MYIFYIFSFFFFKQKTAYEMRISDWSSDVCSSDLGFRHQPVLRAVRALWLRQRVRPARDGLHRVPRTGPGTTARLGNHLRVLSRGQLAGPARGHLPARTGASRQRTGAAARQRAAGAGNHRSEEHTSELQSLMTISYAV